MVGLHPSLRIGGGHLIRLRGKGWQGKAGRPGGGREQEIGPRSMPSGGLGGRFPCSTSSTEQTRNHQLSGAPTLRSSVLFPVVGAHLPPPPLPLGTHAGRPALGGCDCCPIRLRGLFGAARSRGQGSGQVSRQPPRVPVTAAGSQRTQPRRDPARLSQIRVGARQTLSLRPSLSFPAREMGPGHPGSHRRRGALMVSPRPAGARLPAAHSPLPG